MTVAYLLYTDVQTPANSTRITNEQLFDNDTLEKIWIQNIHKFIGDEIELKKINLSELSEKKAEKIDYIFCSPAVKSLRSQVILDFPDTKVILVNEI